MVSKENIDSSWYRKLAPEWLQSYKKAYLQGDMSAGLIVTIMLIPQSLAYALLAGLPPQIGLYASILPLIAYAVFGTSMTLAVGPVAVASLMTATALTPLATPGSPEYTFLAMQLAMFTGIIYLVCGVFKLGFLSHLLSHPVINGFITGSAILIAVGQLKGIMGVNIPNGSVVETVVNLYNSWQLINYPTLYIGLISIAFLLFARTGLAGLMVKVGISKEQAGLFTKLAPMVVVIVSIVSVAKNNWSASLGIKIVGSIPEGLPNLSYSFPTIAQSKLLLLPALLIFIVSFIESVSVAQSLALKRQQKIKPNKELFGLGAANAASAFSGGYVVVGGFARSVVNFAAGANTPLASVLSAILMTVVLLGFTGYFYFLPHAVLSATIIVAVLGMVDFSTLTHTWKYSKADTYSLIGTTLTVILVGVEPGILVGVSISILSYLWNASNPHIAVVGRVEGTEHFRNVDRFKVQTAANMVFIRIDENLFFGNIQAVEETVHNLLAQKPQVKNVVLIGAAINSIDSTALEVLCTLNTQIRGMGKRFHLAEIKGPVMDRLKNSELLAKLSGNNFLHAYQAFEALADKKHLTN